MKKITLNDCGVWIVSLIIAGILGCVGNYVGAGKLPSETIPGILILIVFGFVGQLLALAFKTPFPAFIYVMLLSMIVALPFSPIAGICTKYVLSLNMMSLVTPILAYAGLTVGYNFRDFLKLSWKAIIVGIVVICGTWFWSALIAQILLKVTGAI